MKYSRLEALQLVQRFDRQDQRSRQVEGSFTGRATTSVIDAQHPPGDAVISPVLAEEVIDVVS